ncbi:MAG: VOC family protein [Gammaproteobacteria bacterium]
MGDTGQTNFLVNLDVGDLEKAARFYGSAFGLQIGRRFGAFGVEMLGSSTPIYLPQITWDADLTSNLAASELRAPLDAGLDFVVDEIELAVQKAVSAGARLEKPIATYQWGKLALMADPFGHGFCSSSSSRVAMTKSLRRLGYRLRFPPRA